MRDYLSEHRLSISELARRENVNVSTAWRWALRGARGTKLETFAIGGKRFTTSEAFQRFVEATTAASSGSQLPQKPATNRQREREIDVAVRYCDDESI